jgi:nucleotide-binding universal stress UspA family protein
MKTLLAAVDFSAVAAGVIAEAGYLARAGGGKVILLHVTEPTAAIIDFAIVSMSVARVDEERVAQAKVRLEAMRQELATAGTTAEVHHAIGAPVPEIVAAALQFEADAIVIGSHGHSALHDAFVGSTTAGVVKRAPCPVVVIPSSLGRSAAPTTAPGAEQA